MCANKELMIEQLKSRYDVSHVNDGKREAVNEGRYQWLVRHVSRTTERGWMGNGAQEGLMQVQSYSKENKN